MEKLRDRIRREGRNLGNGILWTSSFIDQQIDPVLMDACGQEFARLFKDIGANKVLTVETSGIVPAVMTARHLHLPVVFARKDKPITMPDYVLSTSAQSHTRQRVVNLIVAPEFLVSEDRVLIIDDFLASGITILGLVRLVQMAGATILGIGALIEKSFEGGREALSYLKIPIESLACIKSMEGDIITFCE